MEIRHNRLGHKFEISAVNETTTEVKLPHHSIKVPMPLLALLSAWDKWQAGAYVQDAFRGLSADDREFFMTGIDAETWDNMFPED
jgi:hypothetical protein